jgi:hypothetical protein
MASAQVKMKALVLSRLLMRDIANWTAFDSEWQAAGRVANRRAARSVSSQIGRSYGELTKEIENFIRANFLRCEYDDLARLCDEVRTRRGLSLPLAEFEKEFFPLAQSVKQRVPFYAHVHISPFGLQFEFPEHHFLNDIESCVPDLLEALSALTLFARAEFEASRDRGAASELVGKEKFLSRAIISAAFNLIEAFLSGLFFTAVHTKAVGSLVCDEEFLEFARKKESAALRDRLDRVVRFSSLGSESGESEPFKTLVETGKRYRDAIHHTTPFGRKDVEPGGRLTALYEIDGDIALRCVVLVCRTILEISRRTTIGADTTDLAIRCQALLEKASTGHLNREAHGSVQQ